MASMMASDMTKCLFSRSSSSLVVMWYPPMLRRRASEAEEMDLDDRREA